MIALGCDHGGYELMQEVKAFLEKKGYEYKDFGCYSTDAVDYPEYGRAAAEAVASGECESGIIICGTGIGISISANKVPGIRCALCSDCFSAAATKEHNNANILCFGGRVTGPVLAAACVDAWLSAEFLGGRHAVRVDMIGEIEKSQK